MSTVTPSKKASSSGKKNAHLTSLVPISEAMGANKSPKEVLQLILKSAHSITRASTASLMLVEPGTKVLRVKAAEGFKDRKIFQTQVPIGQGVTGWVAESGVPLRLGNVTKDERYIRVQRGLRSELAVPLKIRGKIIGVISVDSTRLDHFSSEDEELLLSLAAQSARVIQTTRLHEETQRRAGELRLLIEAGRTLAATLDLGQILKKLVALSAEFWHVPLAAVYLVSDDGKALSLAASQGGSQPYREQLPFKVKGSLVGGILKAKDEAVTIPDLAMQRPSFVGEAIVQENVKALLAAPLVTNKHPLGVLCLFASDNQDFSKEQHRLLSGLASSASLAIENAYAHRRMLDAEESLRGSEKANLLVEMASGLAHDVRNPLTSIKILNEAMLHSDNTPPDFQEDAQMIQKQVARLEQIVDGYLDSARAHATIMERKRFDLNGIVDETILLLATSVEKGTRLSCKLPSRKLIVLGDAPQLSQAIYNLVLNAVQAVGQQDSNNTERGRIEVTTGKLKKPESGVFFEVADEGPGLAEKVRANLFKPFLTTKSQGVGLGLSIVRRIVQAHGGELEIESPRNDLGHGARFRIKLPSPGLDA